MSKFRVGDVVRMNDSSSAWSKGEIGIVTEVDLDGGFKVMLSYNEWWFGDYTEFCTELAEPKVHITGGGSGGGAFAGGGGVTWESGSSRLADALKKDMLLGISGDSVTIYPNPPHKHQIEIIAWANGAVIEFYHDIMGWTSIKHPSWAIYVTYRVKPTKTPLQIEIEELEAKLVKLKGQL